MEIKQIKTEDLVQDGRNFNKGTAKGERLMTKSLRELGAGRGILVDKNGNIIAGNKTQLAAIKAGIKKAVVVQTEGDALVVTQRTDIDINTKKGRELALADNATTEANLCWDIDEIQQACTDFGLDMDESMGWEYRRAQRSLCPTMTTSIQTAQRSRLEGARRVTSGCLESTGSCAATRHPGRTSRP